MPLHLFCCHLFPTAPYIIRERSDNKCQIAVGLSFCYCFAMEATDAAFQKTTVPLTDADAAPVPADTCQIAAAIPIIVTDDL